MRVIDFRARVNTPEASRYLAPRLADIRSLGIPYFDGGEWYDAPAETVDEFVGRLDAAGIEAVALVGRNRSGGDPDWPLTNEWVAEVVERHPHRFYGFAGVDATDLETAPQLITDAVEELGLVGANVDPYQIDAGADDKRFDGVYETCSGLGIPLILTFGAGPGIPADLRCWPLDLDRVARRFPTLTLIACHGAWPFLTEMIAVAWRNPNVYFDNSFYHFAPGAHVVVDAVNTMIGEKMVYSSAYPFCPLEETLERFLQLGFTDTALENVLYRNAQRILRIGVAA
jgi:predicted TIM-barrel fold metal-dependent hydrolase